MRVNPLLLIAILQKGGRSSAEDCRQGVQDAEQGSGGGGGFERVQLQVRGGEGNNNIENLGSTWVQPGFNQVKPGFNFFPS